MMDSHSLSKRTCNDAYLELSDEGVKDGKERAVLELADEDEY
jgi:hypothetical protein